MAACDKEVTFHPTQTGPTGPQHRGNEMNRTRERVGVIQLPAAQARISYETAAWYKVLDCPAQVQPVHLSRTFEGYPSTLHWGQKGICVDACFVSLAGGMPFGKDYGGKQAIGEECVSPSYAYAYNANVLAGFAPDPGFEWLLDSSTFLAESRQPSAC